MTIQREYSLPNCRLVLDGVTEEIVDSNAPRGLPLMSTLANVRCYLPGLEQPISGGSEFFQSLVATVSKYAQSVLSGVRSPELDSTEPAWVRLEKGEKNMHRLIVQDLEEKNGKPEPIQVDLTTPQLFDLVEAVDQFFADKRTLPKLRLELTPVAKKYARRQEGGSKRTIPLAIGVSSVAVAAIAFFFLPVPEVKRPTEPLPENSSQESTPATEGSSNGSDDPPGGSTTPEGAASLESALDSIPEISDSNQLALLQDRLYQELDEAWGTDRTNEKDLAYQVGVSSDGAILGFKPENEAARNYRGSTPLSKLLYVPTDGGTAASESLARFRVVFRENETLEVNPWQGYGNSASSPAPEITDTAVLEDLLFKLRSKINEAWTQETTFDRQLVYRLSVTEEGAIVDYESINQPALDYLGQTPLRSLHDPSAAVSRSNGQEVREPIAEYRVVFTPRGVLEVSPWKGF